MSEGRGGRVTEEGGGGVGGEGWGGEGRGRGGNRMKKGEMSRVVLFLCHCYVADCVAECRVLRAGTE